jgi:hypothetical protein
MKAAPEFVKSPYRDIYTDTVKLSAPPDLTAELEKAYQEYLAERQRKANAWLEAAQAAIDDHRGRNQD